MRHQRPCACVWSCSLPLETARKWLNSNQEESPQHNLTIYTLISRFSFCVRLSFCCLSQPVVFCLFAWRPWQSKTATLFGNRVTAGVMSWVRMRSSGRAPMQCHWCPYKQGIFGHQDRLTQKTMWREGRWWPSTRFRPFRHSLLKEPILSHL